MTDLTPEKRAELRELAERARPLVRHGGTDPAVTYIPAADLLALLDAADERDRLRTWQERVAVAAGIGDALEGRGVYLEADPDAAAERMAELLAEADAHVECPVHCGGCGETLADTWCDHCHGSGCGPGTATGAYEECEWCAGSGKVHVGCASRSYADLAAERGTLATSVERVRALAVEYEEHALREGYGGELWSTTAAAIRRALNAATDTGDAADRYATNEAKQREEAGQREGQIEAGRCCMHARCPGGSLCCCTEAGPDPLDESDHRDRVDRHGNTWQRVHEGCWMEPGFPPLSHGPAQCLPLRVLPFPLTFAPEPPPDGAGDDLTASEGESGSVEGEGADDAPEALLCPECGHGIDDHGWDEDYALTRCLACDDPGDCRQAPSDIAQALIERAVAEAIEQGRRPSWLS